VIRATAEEGIGIVTQVPKVLTTESGQVCDAVIAVAATRRVQYLNGELLLQAHSIVSGAVGPLSACN
jgi:hypothetical protein